MKKEFKNYFRVKKAASNDTPRIMAMPNRIFSVVDQMAPKKDCTMALCFVGGRQALWLAVRANPGGQFAKH